MNWSLIENVLSLNITACYVNLSVKSKNKLFKIVNITRKVINKSQKQLCNIFDSSVHKKHKYITANTSHPLHSASKGQSEHIEEKWLQFISSVLCIIYINYLLLPAHSALLYVVHVYVLMVRCFMCSVCTVFCCKLGEVKDKFYWGNQLVSKQILVTHRSAYLLIPVNLKHVKNGWYCISSLSLSGILSELQHVFASLSLCLHNISTTWQMGSVCFSCCFVNKKGHN